MNNTIDTQTKYKLEVDGFEPIYKGVPPFMKYENGFGYIGVLLEDKESGKLQCHLCGHLVKNLSKHIFHKHKNTTPVEYRKMVGLNLTTPLVSQSTRKLIKNNFLDLTDKKKAEVIARLKHNNKKLHSKGGKYKSRGSYSSSQYENRFGTCPAQAKTLFWNEYKKLGKIPTNNEMSEKLRYIVYSRFSSYKQALISWGITEQQYREHVINGRNNAVDVRAENDYFPKYDADEVKKIYEEFFFQNKRFPTWGEVKEQGLPGRVPFKRAFGMDKSELELSLKVKECQFND